MPSYSTAYQRLQDSSIAAVPSKADAERAMPGFPTVRTQTIEFAPYPRLRRRTSRNKSPHDQPATELSARNHTTNVSATEYNNRTLITALFCGSSDSNNRNWQPYLYSTLSARNDAYISKCNTPRNERELWRVSGPAGGYIPTNPSLLACLVPPAYT